MLVFLKNFEKKYAETLKTFWEKLMKIYKILKNVTPWENLKE